MCSVRRVLAAWVAALVACTTLSCSSPDSPTRSQSASPPPVSMPTPAAPIRVLMVTATAGFRHDSIPAARQALQTIAAQSGEISVVTTEDLSDVSAARLASVDVLMFALTSGELALDATQKNAIVEFVNSGGGFIGVHSAADTLYEWPDYGRLIGAYFKEHPWTQEAVVSVEDRSHPTSADLAPSIRLLEEFYIFRTDPRVSGHVLLTLDAASVGTAGDFPLAWSQSIGRGRTYYNALGHFQQTWADVRFQTMLRNAIRWVSAKTS